MTFIGLPQNPLTHLSSIPCPFTPRQALGTSVAWLWSPLGPYLPQFAFSYLAWTSQTDITATQLSHQKE